MFKLRIALELTVIGLVGGYVCYFGSTWWVPILGSFSWWYGTSLARRVHAKNS
jgi:hypothetical protein